ncbi:MAG: hypothetical protein ACXVZV_06670 [Terriglobales bacterium]
MTQQLVTPFDTIESAQDFVRVLAETIAEAKQEIQLDLDRELNSAPPRRREALRIAVYNLGKLEEHMTRSRRILNDLRSLRRLLFAEREFHRVRGVSVASAVSDKVEVLPAIVAAIPAPRSLGAAPLSVPQNRRTAIPA